MKKLSVLFVSILAVVAFKSDDPYFNVNKNHVLIDGYDVVSYFSSKPLEGNKDFAYKYNGIVLHFANDKNRQTFKASPEKYMPQYGGWCAYAMGNDGTKVEIDPETYELRDGKLYLFYNKFLTNTLDLWLKEGPEKLKKQADQNWLKFKKTK